MLTLGLQGGEKIAATLNQLGFDAMTLGNHEFDRGDDFVGDFVSPLTPPRAIEVYFFVGQNAYVPRRLREHQDKSLRHQLECGTVPHLQEAQSRCGWRYDR